MANGVAVTAGAGTTIHTDDVSGSHYQVVKLADGTEDSTTRIPGDASRGLLVNPAKRIKRVQVTPTVSSGSAYQDKDQLGGIMEITNAARISAGGGVLLGVTVMCKSNNAPTMVLRFFDRSVTLASDNAAFTVSDADRAFQVGSLILAAGNWETVEGGTPAGQFAQIPAPTGASTGMSLALPYTCNATSLYCAAMITSATTLASTSDLIFSFLYEQD